MILQLHRGIAAETTADEAPLPETEGSGKGQFSRPQFAAPEQLVPLFGQAQELSGIDLHVLEGEDSYNFV